MRIHTLPIAIALVAATSYSGAADEAPDESLVATYLKNPSALATALAHCDPKSAVVDRECRAAQEASKRQFLGTSAPYTPKTVDPFPNAPSRQPFNRPPHQ